MSTLMLQKIVPGHRSQPHNQRRALHGEEQFRLVFDAAPDPLILLNRVGQIVDCNRATCAALGCAGIDDVIGRSVDQISPPYQPDGEHSLAKAQALIQAAFAEEIGSFEWVHRRTDGDEFEVEVTLTCIETEEQLLVGQWRDITDRKATQKQLARANSLLEAAFAQSPAPMVLTSLPDGVLRIVNQACKDFLGIVDEPDVVGHCAHTFTPTWREIDANNAPFPPEQVPLFRAAQGISTTNQEIGYLRKDGTVRWGLVSASPITNDDGQIIAAYSVISDITEHKLAEQALRTSEARYRILAENVRDVIWMMDVDGRFTYASPSIERLRGYTVEEIMGQTLDQALTPASAAIVKQDLQTVIEKVMAGECVVPGRYDLEQPCKDGSTVWTEVEAGPLYDDDGQFVGILGVSRDISERRQRDEEIERLTVSLEQRVEERTAQLAEAVAALERSARTKDEFLATISHELRTPLVGVISMSEALAAEVYGPLTERQQKGLEVIQNSGHQLLGLINNILDFSKVAAGALQLKQESVCVADLCRASMAHVQALATCKQLAMKVSITPADIHLHGDPARIKQILVNLLSNAVKFTPEYGEIVLSARNDPAHHAVVFEVSDTGIGIAAQDISRLFQPFVQLDSGLNRVYPGTGLGLALVHRLTSLHGGRVSASSRIGSGSTFTVTLPQSENGVGTAVSLSRPQLTAQ